MYFLYIYSTYKMLHSVIQMPFIKVSKILSIMFCSSWILIAILSHVGKKAEAKDDAAEAEPMD